MGQAEKNLMVKTEFVVIMRKWELLFAALCMLTVFCSISCGGGANTNHAVEEPLHVIDLDQTENIKTARASEFFADAEVIVLEETNSSLLASIDKICAIGDTLFVMDLSANQVLSFDGSGRFLFKIGRVGRGPGEYRGISDFTIDSKNGRIYILDPNEASINEYMAGDGKFVRAISLGASREVGIRANYIHYFNGGIYTDTYFYRKPKDNYLLRRLDVESGEETDHWLSQDAYNLGWNEMYYTGSSPFVHGDDSLFRFVQLFMDRIVTVTDKGIEHFIGLKSKDMVAVEDLHAEGHSDASRIYRSLLRSDKIYTVTNYIEFGHNIWFNYSRGNFRQTVLYRKDSGQARIVNMLFDDLVYVTDAPGLFEPKHMDSSGKTAYSIEEAYKLLTAHREGSVSEGLIGAEKIAALSDNSNPVIIKYRYE
jgi:hypothetical protein